MKPGDVVIVKRNSSVGVILRESCSSTKDRLRWAVKINDPNCHFILAFEEDELSLAEGG